MISANFDLQVTLILLMKFQVNWTFGSGDQNRFLKWLLCRTSWISDQNDFSHFFYLLVTPLLTTKVRVNRPFGSEEVVQNTFSRWQPSWITDPKEFPYF